MQKYIFLIILVSCFFMEGTFAATIPDKSNTTDPSSSKYYDNTAQNNKNLTPEAKNYAIQHPERFDYFTRQNGDKCGNSCAALFNAEAQKLGASAGSPSAGGGGSATAGSDATVGGGGGGATPVPTSDPNTVIVTEKVPGADCKCDIGDGSDTACDNNLVGRKYKCTITAGGGLIGFQKIMAEITRVFVYITLLLGVLAIVGLGIGYAIFSGGDEEKTKLIKTYAVNLMIGMILLFFFRYILVFLAPWIFQ